MSLLQMSFSGGLMIIVIVIVRALAINKLPKKVFGLLWGAVLIRLLIPFSVPTMLSVYSLVNNNEPIQTVIANTPAEYMIPQIAAVQPNTNTSVAEAVQSQAPAISGWVILWMSGAVLCACFFLITYLRGILEFRTSLPVRNDYAAKWLSDHRLVRTIQIRQSDRIAAPLTYGILRPVILMPKKTDWKDGQQLQYVLSHEYVHIRRFDMAWKLVAALALCIHWFNPLVWVMYILFNRDIELSCDERVVRQYGERARTIYAKTLLTMEEKKSGLMPLCNNFSKNAIEERITAIMKIKKITLWAVMMSTAVLVAVVVLFATTAEGKPLSDTENQEMGADGTVDEFDEDLRRMPGDTNAGEEKNDTNVREEKVMLQYDLENTEEMPATLYVGEGFSIYIPDDGWQIYDETLSAPWLLTAVQSSNISIGVGHYTDERTEEVIAELLSEGVTYNEDTGKFQRFSGPDDLPDLEEWRIYGQDNDVWVVYSRYLAVVEWGSRLDAIADSFAVTVNYGENALATNPEQVSPQLGETALELERLMTLFYTAYFDGDVDTIKGLLGNDYEWSPDVYGDADHADEVEIIQLKGLQQIDEGNLTDHYNLSLELRIPGEDSLTYLSVTWEKENGSWRVSGYGLEK